jgi:hypothetical protein
MCPACLVSAGVMVVGTVGGGGVLGVVIGKIWWRVRSMLKGRLLVRGCRVES